MLFINKLIETCFFILVTILNETDEAKVSATQQGDEWALKDTTNTSRLMIHLLRNQILSLDTFSSSCANVTNHNTKYIFVNLIN